MSAQLIDGKAVAAAVKEDNLKRITALQEKYNTTPGLAVILVGENPASQVYVASKVKMCSELGINSRKYALPAETTQDELLRLIDELNNDPEIHGILVQSPPPTAYQRRRGDRCDFTRQGCGLLQRTQCGQSAYRQQARFRSLYSCRCHGTAEKLQC